jgi:hypothetical protein
MLITFLDRGTPVFAILTALIAIFYFIRAISKASEARRTVFYLRKQEMTTQAWSFLFGCMGWAILAVLLGLVIPFAISRAKNSYETVSAWLPENVRGYLINAPTATPTLTPTPTLPPELIPTQLPTAIPPTPESSPTPTIPANIPPLPIAATPGFPLYYITPVSELLANPDTLVGFIKFGSKINDDYTLKDEQSYFDLAFLQEIKEIVGVFTYTGMTSGVQWTIAWYRDDQLLAVETQVWDGPEAGYGFLDFNPYETGQEWLAGEYRVQIYLTNEFAVESFFTVVPPTE